MSMTMPRSVLRHRPIQADVQEEVIAAPCAIRRQQQPHTQHSPFIRVRQKHPRVLISASMLLTFLLLWMGQGIWAWSRVQLDTLHYGFPRTTYSEQEVGHGGESSFLATNQHGQIYVLEIPEGKTAAAHLLVGPHLLGPNADLAPVHLIFQGDPRHPDLLIEVQSIIMRFRNTGSMYIPMAISS
jgi:hypothetical protein